MLKRVLRASSGSGTLEQRIVVHNECCERDELPGESNTAEPGREESFATPQGLVYGSRFECTFGHYWGSPDPGPGGRFLYGNQFIRRAHDSVHQSGTGISESPASDWMLLVGFKIDFTIWILVAA